uniref:DUF7223 domain-containing protein n=1 Tax=Mycena chlorophos TaxID=658473 RepID=A0ABQ0L8Z2_MYCCL|nr:predicted protein [Mycena chlorophos]
MQLTRSLALVALVSLRSALVAGSDAACRGECSYETEYASVKIEIQLACTSAECEHVFSGHGAVDTIVRLPDECGANTFGRIASVKVDSAQSSSISGVKSATVGNMTGTVFRMEVDTHFAKANAALTGPVSFTIEGYNYRQSASASKRDDSNPTSYNDTDSTTLPALILSETLPIFSTSHDCPNFTATLSASAALDVNLTVSLGLVVAGTVIPANITEFAVFAGLDGTAGGRLEVDGSALGTYSTGEVTLYSVALAGVDVPGIFTLGPTFDLYAQVDSTIASGDLTLGVDLDYAVDNARAYLPAKDQPASGGGFTPDDNKLTLSVLPSVVANGSITGHLIPQLSVGLNAFSGIATAEVYLNLDASATLDLDLTASASASASTSGNAASGTVDGCLGVDAGIAVNLGAEGDLFGFISGSAEYPIYSGEWEVYETCFDQSSGTSRRRRGSSVMTKGASSSSNLTCPATSETGELVEIVEKVVSVLQGL